MNILRCTKYETAHECYSWRLRSAFKYCKTLLALSETLLGNILKNSEKSLDFVKSVSIYFANDP